LRHARQYKGESEHQIFHIGPFFALGNSSAMFIVQLKV